MGDAEIRKKRAQDEEAVIRAQAQEIIESGEIDL